MDLRVKLPDGELRWMEARFAWVPTARGLPPRLFSISLDIGARKASEATLCDSQAWRDLALSSIDVALWDRDLPSARIRTSGNYGRFYGLEDQRREWTAQEFSARIAPEDQALVCKAFDDAVQNGHDYAPHFRAILPDGRMAGYAGWNPMVVCNAVRAASPHVWWA